MAVEILVEALVGLIAAGFKTAASLVGLGNRAQSDSADWTYGGGNLGGGTGWAHCGGFQNGGVACRAYNGGNQGGSDGFTKCVEIITVGLKMTALVRLIAIELKFGRL
jgi:hypothetical protein